MPSFSPNLFALCEKLKGLGLEPRFEVGDLVARGFADLGFEEFQVLPGSRLLSLTAGTLRQIPDEHRHFFFWIPSVDEAIELIELKGGVITSCERIDARDWRVEVSFPERPAHTSSARSFHEVLILALLRGSEAIA
jgi:hypothetical protein